MSSSHSLALGLDFGTSSVRALLADTRTGEEIAVAVADYPSGEAGVLTDPRDSNVARQNPRDYIVGFEKAVRDVLCQGARRTGFSPDQIVGIGVDTTASTPIPVDATGTPLAALSEFADDLAAQAWLWKDHSGHAEAAEITDRARAQGLPYLAKCGGAYSSEWYWSKILRCERTAPRVAQAAYAWVELCDWIPAWLTGNLQPADLPRGICAAGHKAMYHPSWGGLPEGDFLDGLAPGMSRFRSRFATPQPADKPAGTLLPAMAERVGLRPGTPVAIGAIDAHLGAVGAGIAPGTLVKIIGTSACDCMVVPLAQELADIPGVAGIVPESILPGMHGIEAGQAAVGDLFNWFVTRVAGAQGGAPDEIHRRLSDAAARLKPGESGLIALDWINGNRNVLADPLLSAMIVGQTLGTTPPDIYRAWIEATAFGARKIIERIGEYGVPIDRVVACGGIAEKSPLLMQIYADVLNRPMLLSRSGQTCALGAAIMGAVVGGAHPSVAAAQAAMTAVKSEQYPPRADAAGVYERLYRLYGDLHDSFGGVGIKPLGGVMKELLAIRNAARSTAG